MEEFLHNAECFLGGRGFVAVDGDVPSDTNVLSLLPDGFRHECSELGAIQIAVEVLDTWRAQGLVDLVDPLDQPLECMACMEARGAWVTIDMPLRQRGALRDERELLLEEVEVGGDIHEVQSSPWNARCCRAAKRVSSSSR